MGKEDGIYTSFKRDIYELEREIFTSFTSLMRNISEHFFPPSQMEIFKQTLYKKDFCNGAIGLNNSCVDSTYGKMEPGSISLSITFIAIFMFTTWIFNRHFLKNATFSAVLNFIVCYLIIIPCLPFIALFYAAIAICRIYIWVHFRIFYNGKRFLAYPTDSFWFEEKFASSSVSVGLYIIKGKCEPERIRKRMEKVVKSDLVEGMMERICIRFLGFACWQKVENLDMNDHIKVVMKERTPENPATDNDVFNFMSTFQDEPIRDKCPWEVLIIPNFTYGNDQSRKPNHYAVIFRLHHAIMDGISSGNILHSIIADKPFEFLVDPLKPLGKKMSKFSVALFYITAFFNLPHSGLNNLFLMDNRNDPLFRPGPHLEGNKEFFWTRPFKMEALRKIKTATKTPVFTVMLSCMGGAYSNIKGNQLGDLDFVGSISPVALLPYPNRKPRNGFSGILFPVAVNRCMKPRERLTTIFNLAQKHATMLKLIGNYYLIVMFGLMPTIFQRIGGPWVHLKTTMTNIPGPAETVRLFDGDTLVDLACWIPIKWTTGFGMGIISYGDKIRATILADKTSFSTAADIRAMKSEFENQLVLLAKSVGIQEKDIFLKT